MAGAIRLLYTKGVIIMNNEQFSLKELYDVVIKCTYPMEVNGRNFEPGEVIARFDKIQLSNFQEIKNTVAARGGFDNRGRVYWTTTKEVQLMFSQGIFSKTQFALLTGAQVIYNSNTDNTDISNREEIETDGAGRITLSKTPNSKVFFYDAETGTKLEYVEKKNERQYEFATPYQNIIADYTYLYNTNSSIVKIGRQLTNGFLSLEARTKVKFDETGNITTGIIKIPKLKLMSELSMRLGEQSSPITGTFMATAIPVGERGNTEVMEIIFLDEYLDPDR